MASGFPLQSPENEGCACMMSGMSMSCVEQRWERRTEVPLLLLALAFLVAMSEMWRYGYTDTAMLFVPDHDGNPHAGIARDPCPHCLPSVR